MNYLLACCTDRGSGKQRNQDALLVKRAVCDGDPVILAVLCDGMGGLARGEVASASLTKAFSVWFEQELPAIAAKEEPEKAIVGSWGRLLRTMNRRIGEYGSRNRLQLGTTVTAMLFLRDIYYIVHVGDSRAYELGGRIRQLTKDQTLVEREVEQGLLTPQEAKDDPRRNVLLQCVGALEEVEPMYRTGPVREGFAYLLCCDGLWRMASSGEIFHALAPARASKEKEMEKSCKNLVALNRERGEQDDISVIVISAWKEGEGCCGSDL